MSGFEIVVAIIVIFFSGVWSAIKAIDEKTDNKAVFFVPASILALFVLSGIGDGLLFLGCLFAFGPIIVMLVYVGLHQGTGKAVNYGFSRRDRWSRKPLDLNRELAPSYIRGYDRLIAYLHVRGYNVQSRQGVAFALDDLGIQNRFLSSPYVIKALNLTPIEPPKGKTAEVAEEDEKWWEEDTDEPDTKTIASPVKKKSAESYSKSTSSEMCSHSGCSNSVNAFDFRCFTCRKRFCKTHVGSSIECADCS